MAVVLVGVISWRVGLRGEAFRTRSVRATRSGRFEPIWVRPRCALHIASRYEPTPKPALRFGFLREARYEAMTCPITSGWCCALAVLLKPAKPFMGCLSTKALGLNVAGLALPFLRRQERKQSRRPGCLVPARLRGRSSLALLAAMGRSRTHCAQAGA
jgi:hypothetical protein